MDQFNGNPKAVDPNTSLPPAVRRQAEEAERLRQAQEAAQRGEQAPEPQPPTSEPQPPVGGSSEPQPEPPAPPADNDDSWKQRYLSEQGRTKRLRADLEGAISRINEMEHLIATMQTAAPAQPPKERSFDSLITPEDREQWGEVLPIIEKRAKELIAPLEAQLSDKIAELDQRIKGVGTMAVQDAKSRMLQTLDEHPLFGKSAGENYWLVINDDDRFIDWVKIVDRHSGRLRKTLLQEAFNANDAARVAAFFEDYLRESGKAAPAQEQRGNGAAQPGKPTLENFAAPGRPRHAPTPPGPAPKPIITTGDISRFYADKAAKRFNTPELQAWAEAYDKDIFAAQAEGRIKPGPPSP